MGIQGGRAHGIKTQELFKIKANRLVSGVLIINVRHDDPDVTGSNEFDVNQAFASTNDVAGITLDGWKLAGTNVSSSGGSLWSSDAGQYPYRGARPNFTNASDAGLSTAVSTSDQGFAVEREISAFTKAAPGVITVSGGHFFVNGDTVRIKNVGGSSDWEQLNGNIYQVLQVEIKDLTGAGDSFLAALARKFVEEGNIFSSINYANDCATIVVQQKGVNTIR